MTKQQENCLSGKHEAQEEAYISIQPSSAVTDKNLLGLIENITVNICKHCKKYYAALECKRPNR